jgi:photosystem II stability/assembly factor-like uncharacterized protein
MHLELTRPGACLLLAALAAGCAGPATGQTASQAGPEAPASPETSANASGDAPAEAAAAPSPASPATEAGWQTHAAPIAATLHNGFFLHGLPGKRAWIIGHQSGQVLRTVDGGATWQPVITLREGFLETIYFVDAGRGFLAGDGGRLLATSDGGATWRPALQAPADVAFYGLVFFTPEHGFAGGVDVAQRRGRMFETRDGGRTWSDRSAELTGFGFTDALAMLGPGQALVGGTSMVYRTEDRGATWQAIDVGARGGVRGLFAGAEKVWAVGAKGLVAQSSDQGRTWSVAAPFTEALLRSVVFVDEREGFAAGDRNGEGIALWHTRDGGSTWQPDPSVTTGIHRLILGAGRLWAVGEDGALLSRALR